MAPYPKTRRYHSKVNGTSYINQSDKSFQSRASLAEDGLVAENKSLSLMNNACKLVATLSIVATSDLRVGLCEPGNHY